MQTVKQISELSGISVRALHYYDEVGLLPPSRVTDAGYRLYDDAALERLQCILLFRELEFPLKEIKRILDSPSFDRGKALEQQIELLQLKHRHIEGLIELAQNIKKTGVTSMDFSAFDTSKMDEYAAQAKETWGQTDAYHEFEQKSKGRTEQDTNALFKNMMYIFKEFGDLRASAPEDKHVQTVVEKLRRYITEHFYNCTPQILQSLGMMYAAGGSMTENIDKAGGDGTAVFAAAAIDEYCKTNR